MTNSSDSLRVPSISKRYAFYFISFALAVLASGCARAQPTDAPSTPLSTPAPADPAVVIEAEDFKPQGADANDWRVLQNGQGNYMVDSIGFTHISGERVLSAPANAKDARAVAQLQIPASGDYKLWARFEQPVGTENRFRVIVRQAGQAEYSQVFGVAAATKYFFGQWPTAEAGAPWGWEGLVEQGFEIKGLQAGTAQIELVAEDQSTLAAPHANRNVDFLFLTQDLNDTWRTSPQNTFVYPILDAALRALPPRYYLHVSSASSPQLKVSWKWNRTPWRASEGVYQIAPNAPGVWMPLGNQDVSHWSTLVIEGAAKQGLQARVELASDPQGRHVLRTLDWNDPASNLLLLSLPPYPEKYAGEKIMTVEEQYRDVADYLKTHPSRIGREPTLATNAGNLAPAWDEGRVGEAAFEVYHALGMRAFIGFAQPQNAARPLSTLAQTARRRFARWNMTPNRSLVLGAFRQFPTPENIARAKSAAQAAGLLPFVQRFDYGDEISFSEWLKSLSDDELKTRFADWQKTHGGKVEFEAPDSSAATANSNPKLFIDSLRFYEDTAIELVAAQAKAIPQEFGPNVFYGANYLAHPYYYPEIAKYIKWFRKTPGGDYAANFGRHSEYFWQVGQPGPMVDGYIAEHFLAGMRNNPQAVNLQYTMPHSPGNTDASFRRSAFTHLAHGARGLDFFDIGVNSSDTENYIDFRDKERFAAIRDINRAMATIEDILPTSRPAPSRVALILSDSTERWDLAAISADRAGNTIGGIAGVGANNPQVRLAYHQERVGIYYALVNNNRPPDLLTEEDVQSGALKNYDVAYWVGDCAMPQTVSTLRTWVESGGHLVATAGAFRFDEYRQPVAQGRELLGIKTSELNEATRFVRPLIELPNLKPLDEANGMPALAILDSITPETGTYVLAWFKSGKPAATRRVLGKGDATYIATLPGLAYLWSAYQPPPIASRGPSSHVVPQNFNATAERLILQGAQNVTPQIDAHGAHIDARLLVSPNGFAIPLANYNADVSRPIKLTIHGISIKKISSAVAGPMKGKRENDGSLTIEYSPGLGDILRLEP